MKIEIEHPGVFKTVWEVLAYEYYENGLYSEYRIVEPIIYFYIKGEAEEYISKQNNQYAYHVEEVKKFYRKLD